MSNLTLPLEIIKIIVSHSDSITCGNFYLTSKHSGSLLNIDIIDKRIDYIRGTDFDISELVNYKVVKNVGIIASYQDFRENAIYEMEVPSITVDHVKELPIDNELKRLAFEIIEEYNEKDTFKLEKYDKLILRYKDLILLRITNYNVEDPTYSIVINIIQFRKPIINKSIRYVTEFYKCIENTLTSKYFLSSLYVLTLSYLSYKYVICR